MKLEVGNVCEISRKDIRNVPRYMLWAVDLLPETIQLLCVERNRRLSYYKFKLINNIRPDIINAAHMESTGPKSFLFWTDYNEEWLRNTRNAISLSGIGFVSTEKVKLQQLSTTCAHIRYRIKNVEISRKRLLCNF